MGRAPCCDKANVKKGPWSEDEDAMLKAYIDTHGTGGNWLALPHKIGLKRCGKSCRLRWLNYLRPDIKHGGFTEEEDSVILDLYISVGSRWSIIAAQLPGRTDNDIKNYWNTKLKKKLLGQRKEPKLSGEVNPPSRDDKINGPSYTPSISNSALERIQLRMQLQDSQNPSSFYNNLTLWPKLHPLQEKMIHNLQYSSEHLVSLNPSLNPNHKQGEIKAEPRVQTCTKIESFQVEEVEINSFNGSTSFSGVMGLNPRVKIQTPSIFGAEEINCFKSMEASKEVATMMSWWPSEQLNLVSWDSSASSMQPTSSNNVHDYPLDY